MHFVLIVEHPDRPRISACRTTAGPADRYTMLRAGSLSDAANIAARVENTTPLLRIHLTHARPASNATVMALPPRQSSIVSLIHDASLLRIADGAVITADSGEGDGDGGLLVRGAAATLAGIGYRVSSVQEALGLDLW